MCNDHECMCYDGDAYVRIAELEKECAESALKDGIITELSAENARLREMVDTGGKAYADLLINSVKELRAAEAKLAAVERVLKQWDFQGAQLGCRGELEDIMKNAQK